MYGLYLKRINFFFCALTSFTLIFKKGISEALAHNKTNSVALVRTRSIPTERPPPVGEVSANFLWKEGCHVVSATGPHNR